MRKERRPLGRFSSVPQLRLSLASPVLTLVRLGQAGMAILVAGSLAFVAWCWTESQSLEAKKSQYTQSVGRVKEMNRQFGEQMRQDGLTMSQPDIAEVYKRVQFANGLIEKQAFSWTQLLSNLDAALPPRVSISSVHLSFKDSTVRLQGSVMTIQDLEAMVDRLESHDAFMGVKVSNHQFDELREQLPTRKRGAGGTTKKPRVRQIVKFQLRVGYRPSV